MSNSIEKQNLIFEILNFASNEIGFSFENCEIIVEAFSVPLKDSFVLIITRIPESSCSNKLKLYAGSNKKYKLLTTVTCLFNSFEDFCMFCNSINKFSDFDSSLFLLDNRYYLFIKFNKIHCIKPIISSLTEFAKKIYLNKNLSEFSKAIIKNKAIETCKKYCI